MEASVFAAVSAEISIMFVCKVQVKSVEPSQPDKPRHTQGGTVRAKNAFIMASEAESKEHRGEEQYQK